MNESVRSYIDFDEESLREYLEGYDLYDIEKEAIVHASFFLKKELQTGQPAVEKIPLFHFLRKDNETRALLRGEEPKAMEYFVQLLEKWSSLFLIKVHLNETGSEVVEFINPEYEKVLAHYLNASSSHNFSFPKAKELKTSQKFYRYHQRNLREINLSDILKFSKEKAVVRLSIEGSEDIFFPSRGWQILLQGALKNCVDHFRHSQFSVVFRKAMNNFRTDKQYQNLNEDKIINDLEKSMTAFPLDFYNRFFYMLSTGLNEADDFPEKDLLVTSVAIVGHGITLKEATTKEQKKSAERQLHAEELIHFLEKQPQPIHRDYLLSLNKDEAVKKIFRDDEVLHNWSKTIDHLLKNNLIKKTDDRLRASTLIPVIHDSEESYIMAGHLARLMLNKIDHISMECKNEIRGELSSKLTSREHIEYLSALDLLEYKLETMVESKRPLVSFILNDSILFKRLMADVLNEYERPKLMHMFYPNESHTRAPLIKAFKVNSQQLLDEAQSKLPFLKRLWYITVLGRDKQLIRPPKVHRKIAKQNKTDHSDYQDLTIKEELQTRYLKNLSNNGEIAGALERLKLNWNSLKNQEAQVLQSAIQEEADAIVYLNREKASLNNIEDLVSSLDSAIARLVKKYDRSVENSHSLKKYIEIYVASGLIEKT